MRRLSFRTIAYLFIDFFLLLVCFVHVPSIMNRATVPFEEDDDNGGVIVSSLSTVSAAGALQPGDRILK